MVLAVLVFWTLLGGLMLILSKGCTHSSGPDQAPDPEQGRVFLYLSTDGDDGSGVWFRVAEVAFRTRDGIWHVLPVQRVVSARELEDGGQILLGELGLPPGGYDALRLRLAEAGVARDKKRASLALPHPNGFWQAPISFRLGARQCLGLFLRWRPQESVRDTYLFAPRMEVDKQGQVMRDVALYVSCADSDAVCVVNRDTDTVGAVVAVGRGPRGLALAPGGDRLYVANTGSRDIDVLDTSTLRVGRTIANFGLAPRDLVLDGEGRWLFASNPDGDEITVVDATCDLAVRRIRTGDGPGALAVDDDRGLLYVANARANTVSVVGVQDLSVQGSLAPGQEPTGLAVQDGLLWVANRNSNSVAALSPGGQTRNRVPSLPRPWRLLAGLSDRVYASLPEQGAVAVVYAPMGALVRTLDVGGSPGQMAVDRLRRKLYVVDAAAHAVQVVDLTANAVAATIEVGREPWGIALAGE